MSQVQKLLLLLAAALVAGGVILGFARPVYDANGVRCGTAFNEDGVSQIGATLGPAGFLPECEQPLSDAKLVPWMLIGAGAFALAGVVVTRPKRTSAEASSGS